MNTPNEKQNVYYTSQEKEDKQYYYSLVSSIGKEIQKVIFGQKEMLQSILCTLLSRGHILLEGVPGLAKSLAVSTFSRVIGGEFQRIQFTPDKLPGDITGTTIYNEASGEFEFYHGPVFCNLLLADEINRASPKVQSALLESMQEKRVSIERRNFPLPELFMVLASQNPVEQMGTYPLSEAQLDRFMVKYDISYPAPADEAELLKKKSTDFEKDVKSVIQITSPEEVVKMQELVANSVVITEPVIKYIQSICLQTRKTEDSDPESNNGHILVGISPRGAEHLIYYCKSFAFVQGRDYVNFNDVDQCAPLVLSHRLVLNESALMEGVREKFIINKIISKTSPW